MMGYIYIYLYIHIYIYVYVYIYVYMYICITTHRHTHNIHIYIYTHIVNYIPYLHILFYVYTTLQLFVSFSRRQDLEASKKLNEWSVKELSNSELLNWLDLFQRTFVLYCGCACVCKLYVCIYEMYKKDMPCVYYIYIVVGIQWVHSDLQGRLLPIFANLKLHSITCLCRFLPTSNFIPLPVYLVQAWPARYSQWQCCLAGGHTYYKYCNSV